MEEKLTGEITGVTQPSIQVADDTVGPYPATVTNPEPPGIQPDPSLSDNLFSELDSDPEMRPSKVNIFDGEYELLLHRTYS